MNHHLIIQTECTLFFEQNPYAFETVEGLTDRLGRKVEHIAPVLEQLVSLSILLQVGTSEHILYGYRHPDVIVLGGLG